MACSKVDPMVFSSAVEYISAMLSLSGPMSLPELFYHVKLSPFSSEIGNNDDEFELFLFKRPEVFRVKVDVRNIHRFEDKVSNKRVSLKSAFIVPVIKRESPESKRDSDPDSDSALVTTDVNGLKIKKKCKKQLPLSVKCEDVVTLPGDNPVPVGDKCTIADIKSQNSGPTDSFINEENRDCSLQNSISCNHAGVLKLGQSTSNFSESTETSVQNNAVKNLEKLEAGRLLEQALLKRGSLPVCRLVGHVHNMKKSMREAVGTYIPKLLKFLRTDDRFNIEGEDNVVSLHRTKIIPKSTTGKYLEGNSIKLTSANESNQAICNLDVSEGERVLRNAILKNGSLPVFRLVGYLAHVKKSIRESLGRNSSDLLQFLKANDQFVVSGTNHVVCLKNSKEITSQKSIAVQEENSIATTKSKALPVVTKKNGKVPAVKSVITETSSCPDEIQRNRDNNLVQARLISTKLARRKVSQIVTKAIHQKGPLTVYKLTGYFKQMRLKSIKKALSGGSFADSIDFLLHRKKFVIQNDKCSEDLNKIELESIISLNPEWQQERARRKKIKGKGSCKAFTKIVDPKNNAVVSETDHVVHLKTSKMQTSQKSIEVQEENSIATTKSKALVTKKNGKVSAVMSVITETNPSPEETQQNEDTDLVQAKLISTKLARRQVSQIVTKAIHQKGPLTVYKFRRYFGQTTKSIKKALNGGSFPHYLDFLLHRKKFVIVNVKCSEKGNRIKRKSIISLNPEWQQERLDRKARLEKIKEKRSCKASTKIVDPENNDHVVCLKTSKMQASQKTIAVQEKNSITTTKSKALVTEEHVKVPTVKCVITNPNTCSEEIQRNENKDLVQAELISTKLARRKVSHIVAKAIRQKGPLMVSKLRIHFDQITRSIETALHGGSFPHYLDFLLHRKKFDILNVKCSEEGNRIKRKSIISLNPEWQQKRQDRKAHQEEIKENKSDRVLTKIVDPKNLSKSKLQSPISEYDNSSTPVSPADSVTAHVTLLPLSISKCSLNTPTNNLISSQMAAPELDPHAAKLVKDFVLQNLLKVKSMRFKTLKSILLNCSIPECQKIGEDTNTLLKFLHEQEFVIKGKNQYVELKNQSERVPTCSFNSVRVTNKSAKKFCDASTFTNDPETDSRKLCFMKIIAKHVKNNIREYGPVSMDGLKNRFSSKLFGAEYYGVTVDDFLLRFGNVFAAIDDTVYLVRSKEYISLSVKSEVSLENKKQISTPLTIESCPEPVLETHHNVCEIDTKKSSVNRSNVAPTRINIPQFKAHPHPCFGLNTRNKSVPAASEIKEGYKNSCIQQIHNKHVIPNSQGKLTTTDEQNRKNILRRWKQLLPPANGIYRSFFSKLGLVGDIPPDDQNSQSGHSRWHIPSNHTDITDDSMCPEMSNESDEITVSPDQSSSQRIMSQTYVNSKFSYKNACVNNQMRTFENNKLNGNGNLPSTGWNPSTMQVQIGRVLYPWE